MKYRIYLSKPTIDKEEITSVTQALESGWITSSGEAINSFTEDLEKYFHKNILLTQSGTSAIHLALKLSNVERNDFVLCSNFTFAASAFPILYQNAIPVFIGIEKQTWNASIEFIKMAVNQLPKKPKALILTHVYGMPADLNAISDFCKEQGISLIEDAAEALGATFENKPLGSFGNYGAISFNGNKIITTSGGGALIISSEKEKNKAQYWASQA